MRLPRPNRLRRVSVCSLSRQLGVGEAMAYGSLHGESEAVLVRERLSFVARLLNRNTRSEA